MSTQLTLMRRRYGAMVLLLVSWAGGLAACDGADSTGPGKVPISEPGSSSPYTPPSGLSLAMSSAESAGGIVVRRSTGSNFSPTLEKWTEAFFVGSKGTFFADVTGDSVADAIAVNSTNILVRPSDSRTFLPTQTWSSYGYYGYYGTFFADVTGDKQADAIAVNKDGIWIRGSSTSRTKFADLHENWTGYKDFHGERGTFFVDVTKDGKADAIAVNNTGIVVRPADKWGSQFLANQIWADKPYYSDRTGSVDFADVTGDGRADAIVVNNSGIVVRPADSTGAPRFLPNQIWVSTAYYGTYGTFFADVTGPDSDGKRRADVIVINDWGVSVRKSTGKTFGPSQIWITGKYYDDCYESASIFADVTGDRKADALLIGDGTEVCIE